MSKYREQFERVGRFLHRVRRGDRESVEYLDDLWAFFQNAWHLKDWIMNDSSLQQELRDRVVDSVHSSEQILLCGALANRSKHLRLRPVWNDADVTGQNVTVFPGQNKPAEYSHNVTLEDGTVLIAQTLAEDAVKAWESILAQEGLI